MFRRLLSCAVIVLVLLACGAYPVSAQPIGTFSWQLSPHCNIVTISVSFTQGVYTLDGYDNQCNAGRRAPLSGVATPNPDGSIGLGMTIVNTPSGEPTHIQVAVDLGTFNGTWFDSGGNSGNFLFNGPGGGVARTTGEMQISRLNFVPTLYGRRTNGTLAAPTALQNSQQFLSIDGRGYDGVDFDSTADAAIRMSATQDWTNAAHGSRISFATTEEGTSFAVSRMFIDHDGYVAIGVADATSRLHVGGNIRMTGCLIDDEGGGTWGTCESDSRFKRDIASYGTMLDKVAGLRPVSYFWRNDEFAAREFGTGMSHGLIAQEVEAVLPELVHTRPDGYKAVNYGRLPLLAVQAIKELKAKNDALESRAAELERRLAALEARAR